MTRWVWLLAFAFAFAFLAVVTGKTNDMLMS